MVWQVVKYKSRIWEKMSKIQDIGKKHEKTRKFAILRLNMTLKHSLKYGCKTVLRFFIISTPVGLTSDQVAGLADHVLKVLLRFRREFPWHTKSVKRVSFHWLMANLSKRLVKII